MITTRRTLSALSFISMIGVAACGSALPPRELINARAAYQKAQGGPAAEHAPAELDAAMQALRRAETTFDEDGDTEDTRDLAYIAECAAQKAEAKGGATKAARDLEETDKTYKKVQAEQLDTTRRALESVERARAYQEEEAKRAKAEAEKTKEALEKERKARLDAEKKLGGALASLEQMAKVKQEARGVVISLSGEVLFATGKSELLPIAQQKLEQVAQALKDQGYKRIVVEGHTDSRGARTQNMDLSLARAESVRMYLISRGIDANKISAVGLGPDRPVADNATPDGRANNRRVELIVTPE